MSTRRCLRVARSIKEIVSRVIIFELADPRMGFVTVTEVDVSPDMTQAVVKLSIMGDEKHSQRCLDAIRHAAGHIQGVVNKELGIKIVPRVRFEIDPSIKKSVEISRLIEQAVSEYQHPEEPAQESTGETDLVSAEDEGDEADAEGSPDDDDDEENVE